MPARGLHGHTTPVARTPRRVFSQAELDEIQGMVRGTVEAHAPAPHAWAHQSVPGGARCGVVLQPGAGSEAARPRLQPPAYVVRGRGRDSLDALAHGGPVSASPRGCAETRGRAGRRGDAPSVDQTPPTA